MIDQSDNNVGKKQLKGLIIFNLTAQTALLEEAQRSHGTLQRGTGKYLLVSW